MKIMTLHGVKFECYSPEETACGAFYISIQGCEGLVTDDEEPMSFGLYRKDGKWTLFTNKLYPEYNWASKDEAIISCIAMHRMSALPGREDN